MTTWVLLRGLTRGSGHWAGFDQLLRERPGSERVAVLDLPGNGLLHRQSSPTCIDAMTQSAREQLRAQGIAPPYVLVAVSMGAMVAIDWAVRAPQELAGAVLINTSVQPFSPWHQRLRPASALRLLGGALRPHCALTREAAVLSLTSRRPAAAAAVHRPWAALHETQPVSLPNALRQLWASARFRAPLAAPRPPLLVLSSRGDALVDPRCSARLARQWHAASAVHPWAGHDLTLDDGPWVAQQIARWRPQPA